MKQSHKAIAVAMTDEQLNAEVAATEGQLEIERLEIRRLEAKLKALKSEIGIRQWIRVEC